MEGSIVKKIVSILLTVVLILAMGLGNFIGVFANTPPTSTEDIEATNFDNISMSATTIEKPLEIEFLVDL